MRILRHVQRRIVLEISILVIGLVSIPLVYAYIYDRGTQQISQTIVNVYSGTETVLVTGSIPYEMNKDQFGFFGAVFWNPMNTIYHITRVELNASTASNSVFNGVEQGSGFSHPTIGWTLDGGMKAVYVTTAIDVQPHSAQEFYVRIKGNQITESFQVSIRITANDTVYHQSYHTRQVDGDYPFSVLWLGSGPTPQFVVPAIKGKETTFHVSLQEDSNHISIGSNGKLTIQLPQEFTNIQSVGGIGWGYAAIIGNRIEVNSTLAIRESYITYAFKARAPAYKGLYMFNASFSGTPDEKPIGSFCVRVVDG
jgi:hypothetical protein